VKLGVTANRLEHGDYRIASCEKWLALIGVDTDFHAKGTVGAEDVCADKPVTDKVHLHQVVRQLPDKDDTAKVPKE